MAVRDLINRFQGYLDQINEDLKQFLDLAWSHRAKVGSGSDFIYQLYTRGGKSVEETAAQTIPFFESLIGFPQVPEIQCDAGPEPNDDGLGCWLRDNYGARNAPNGGFALLPQRQFQRLLNLVVQPEGNDIRQILTSTFFHFRRPGGGRANDRIYVHVRPHGLAQVMLWIVTEMVMKPLAHPHMTNGKVGAPGPEERYDTIVLYFATPAGVEKGLAAIAEYQKNPDIRRFFDYGGTRLTKRIDRFHGVELIGVSTGSEPPIAAMAHHGRLRFYTGVSSFGSLRSKVITHALQETLAANRDKDAFIRRVAELFKEAGIDPHAPAVQKLTERQRAMADEMLRRLNRRRR